MRVKTSAGKFGYLLIVAIGLTLTTVPLASVSIELSFWWGVLVIVAAVVTAARTFRGLNETDDPRPWWKMTSTRWSGALLCVLFLLQSIVAISGASASPSLPMALTGGIVAFLLAVLYLNSAVRTGPIAPTSEAAAHGGR